MTTPHWANDGTRLLRVDEAAMYLAVSRSRMYEMLAAREVESVSIGRSRRVPLAALEDYVNSLRNSAADAPG